MQRVRNEREPKLVGVTAVALGLVVGILGCASSPESGANTDPGPTGDRTTADVDDVMEQMNEKVCVRNATVTVRVWNEGSMAVRLGFGGTGSRPAYAPARLAEGFSRTSYQVARPHLAGPVRIEIARGGLQLGGPSYIQTEAVVCNIATLVIGPRPRYSVFYGDVIYKPSDLRAARAGEEEEETEAPADSTSNEGG